MANGNSTAARKARAAARNAEHLVAFVARREARLAAQAAPPRPVGRPPAGATGGRTTQVTAKLSPDERESCELAAQREGKTLSEWARDALLLRAAALGARY